MVPPVSQPVLGEFPDIPDIGFGVFRVCIGVLAQVFLPAEGLGVGNLKSNYLRPVNVYFTLMQHGVETVQGLFIIVFADSCVYPVIPVVKSAHEVMALDPAELRSARERGERYRLLARAERRPDGGYVLSVAPTPLPADHPLGKLGRKQMGVLFSTDIYGVITAMIDEPGPIPSAATMLRDLLEIYS